MKKLLYILLFVPFALFGQDLINIDINSNAIEYTDSSVSWCYEHFTVPSTQIDVKLELIKEIYVSYELSNTIKCGGNCGTIWLEIEIIHDDETLYLYLLDECDIEGTSGNIIFNTNFSSPDSVMPTINFITADITNNSIFVVDSIKYLPAAIFGCTDSSSYNFNPDANIDDGACDLGCMNADAINYDENATEDDEQSCIYSQDYVHGLWNEVDDGAIEFNESVESLSSLQQALDTWNTTIDLSAGWNMFGYGCPTSIDLVQGLSNHTELIAMVKDNNGSAYIPEFDFNGIGDFTPGFGYQIKVTEAIEGFSLCDWYVNDIPEDNIVSLQEEVESLQSELDSIYGCIDENACNYEETASLDDGSCEYPNEGLQCNGDSVPYVGMLAHGGIIFYVDETGQRGMVVAIEDLIDGASNPTGWDEYGYEWGCNLTVDGHFSYDNFGRGYSNTMKIINHGCQTVYGGVNAASAANNFEYQGFNDWFLPSIEELSLINSNIIQHSEFTQLTSFSTSRPYWSSSVTNSNDRSWGFHFGNNNWDSEPRENPIPVRPIRAFGYTFGCTDSLACNYNPEANMADGSCEYAELGYDCDGNITEYIVGMEAEGGIVFYVDETGQHGLVADLIDLGQMDWLDAINTSENATSDIYVDWYLPSLEELELMYNTIGQGADNAGGFNNSKYWSSLEGEGDGGWTVDFNNGATNNDGDTNLYFVRVIRAF